MAELTPITREETLLAAAAGEDVNMPNPITREELFLAKLAGMEVETPRPVSRKELFLQKAIENVGTGDGFGLNEILNRTEPSGDLVHTDPLTTTVEIAELFYNCSGISSFTSEYLTTVGSKTFYGCTGLKSVNLPKLTALTQSMFTGCSALESVNLPCVTDVKKPMVFQNCASLKKIELPLANTETGMTLFQFCIALEFVDMGFVISLNSYLFDKCSALKTIILRNTAVVPIINLNALDKTPFASNGTGGTVYCPASLISEYQQAANWSALYAAGTCNFVAIEGSEYE